MTLLHHSIDRSADKRPDHGAFRFNGSSLTYAQLVGRSNQLANWLVECGLRRMDRVGILMNKRLELPVAVYSILKAGGVFVPIDPTAPLSRLQFIIRDCGIRHLITEPSKKRHVADLLDGGSGPTFVAGCVLPDRPDLVSIGWDELEALPEKTPNLSTIDQDLAYIMYTSGSTGSPKGLMHTHMSGLAYARASAKLYDVRAEDRLGNHAALHFDQSTFEYLTGPLCGATSVLIPEEDIMFPASLGSLIQRERLTFWYSVPLTLIRMVDGGDLGDSDCSSLRWVLFGGEAFPPKYLWRLMDLWPHARFSNCYGPAEVNQCTYFHVPQSMKGSDEPIPIGSMMPGADGIIMDEDGQPAGINEPGELWIRSSTMMQGYWGRPELTESSMVSRQRFPGFHEVYYRTGDLVRLDEHGILHFLGRSDRQIKLRGYRVELDEIENVIAGLDGVAEVAAFPVKDAYNIVSVTVAVLPRAGFGVEASQLRLAASRLLPHYAVPDEFVISDELPTTSTGKIDRRALQTMHETQGGSSNEV